jgi:hypothetical protein
LLHDLLRAGLRPLPHHVLGRERPLSSSHLLLDLLLLLLRLHHLLVLVVLMHLVLVLTKVRVSKAHTWRSLSHLLGLTKLVHLLLLLHLLLHVLLLTQLLHHVAGSHLLWVNALLRHALPWHGLDALLGHLLRLLLGHLHRLLLLLHLLLLLLLLLLLQLSPLCFQFEHLGHELGIFSEQGQHLLVGWVLRFECG